MSKIYINGLKASDYAKIDDQNSKAHGIVALDKNENVFLLLTTKKELKEGVFKQVQIGTVLDVSGETGKMRIYEKWGNGTPVIVINVSELKCVRNAKKMNKE